MMSGDFFQPGIGNKNLRRNSVIPNVMLQAEEPQLTATSAYEGIMGGIATEWAVILTALMTEHKAIEAHLEPFGKDTRLLETIHPNGTIYTQGRFTTSTCAWNVAIAQIDMGNVSAAIEAIRAIEYFNPRVILFVGVAGGIKDVEIGDVVAASVVYSYDCGKVIDDRTLPRPKLGEADYDLLQRAQAEARKDDWRNRIRPSVTMLSEKSPTVYVKPIAAGEKVIASSQSEVYKYLREHYDDAIAVEMEGFGFLKAAQQVKSVSAIVIRGISDLLDDKELVDKKGSQEIAVRHASAFAFEILAKFGGNGNSNPVSNDRQTDDRTIATFADETIQMPLERQFPKDVVILYVEERDGGISLKAFNSEQNSMEPLEICPPPPICLSQIWDCSQSQAILNRLLDYRPRKCGIGQFLGWLLSLRTALQSAASDLTRLIINDRTDFEIPWEMLCLPRQETLGTIVQIIRWHDFADADTWEPVTLPRTTPTSHYCQGKVLIHAGVEAMTAARRGIQALQSYQVVHFSDSQEFLSHLQQSWSEFGLIFISSHDFQSLSKDTIAAYLSYTADIKTSPSMVIIDSSSLSLEQSAIDYRELMAALLECGLKGVIGTLRTVNDREATRIVGDFFIEHERECDVPIPEILRQLRVNAAKQLWQTFNEETCLLYLSTCLYAYHGNQMTMLALTPVEESP